MPTVAPHIAIFSHPVKTQTFLQIIPVTITNGSKTVRTNDFLDSGSDSILISQGLGEKLKLKLRPLKARNALNNEISYQSNLVNFISSK